MVHVPNRRRRKLAATVSAVLAMIVASLAFAAPAQAFPESGYLQTCDPRGSGDVCWWNYSDAHTLDDIRTQTQYGRDQVCAKARYDYTTGAVDPQSVCVPNTDYAAAYFDGRHQLKKGYGYWSGNGTGIWVRVRSYY